MEQLSTEAAGGDAGGRGGGTCWRRWYGRQAGSPPLTWDGDEVGRRDRHADHNGRDGLDVLVGLGTVGVGRCHDHKHEQRGAAKLDAQGLTGVGVTLDLICTSIHLGEGDEGAYAESACSSQDTVAPAPGRTAWAS